ncbi:hypothetical protein [Frondihabitans australicus]|uniref:Uncharacterized protein n=1 Tax=Frondihabitans australicus TaxID=386892 RepID=A0A495IDY3_9MICO|nr:hypothetical protein [Frondihabitans australicus]RKR73335.1 hypothetical protein C8E83_0427 [Frondihabitans australicus]
MTGSTWAFDVVAAGHSSGGVTGFIIFGVAVVLVGITAIVRLRRGGPGPNVQWLPKSMRKRVNDEYEEHGWQKPYDDEGNRNPDRDAL